MANKTNANHEGWNRNTELGCDVKTILRSDRKMKVGKTYRGVLTRDYDSVVDDILYLDAHYTFVETLPSTNGKRNPRGRSKSRSRPDPAPL